MKKNMKKLSLTALSIVTLMGSVATLQAKESPLLSPREFLEMESQIAPDQRVPDDEFNIDFGSGFSLDLSSAFSGDTVGNGHVTGNSEDDFTGEGEDGINDIYLDPVERYRRNNNLNNLMDQLGIDPTTIRSGDTVGNGGGLLESQAYFYYHSLTKHIISVFEQEIIDFSDAEKAVLQEILNGVTRSSSQGKILFISEKEYPGFFFNKDVDPAPRVAKTGFSLEFPIFINRDMVYQRMDKNPRFWLGLLVHEMGHQIGVANHTFLEELGAKVVSVSEINKSELRIELTPNEYVNVSYYNHNFIEAVPDMFVTYKDRLVNVQNWNSRAIREACGPSHIFSGLNVSNVHWENRGVFGFTESARLAAGAWGDVRCYDEYSGAFYNKLLDLHIVIDIDNNYLNAQVFVRK